EEAFPRLRLEAFIDALAALVVADLLEPETRRRRVQQPEQPEMIVLTRPLRQLNHRRGLLEHLPAPVQHKVVVRSNESKSDRVRRGSCILRYLMPGVPRSIVGKVGSITERGSITQFRSKWP